MKYRKAALLLAFIGVVTLVKGQGENWFIPNKGQWHGAVEYRADLPGGKCYLEEKGWTYSLYDQGRLDELKHHGVEDTSKTPTIQAHSIKVELQGALTPSIGQEDASSHYSNFYLGNDPRKWATGLHGYRKIHYSEVYSGVDAHFIKTPQGVKYEFHVAPSGNTGDIQLVYHGADALTIGEDGALTVGTSIRPILEEEPIAYQWVDGEKKTIPCSFHIKGKKKVGFRFPEGYDENKELIIDPSVIFGTYTGSTSDNWGNTATYDNDGHLYAGGTGFGSGYPTTSGAYQINFGGGTCDMTISKFSPDGQNLIYSTYLGGSRNEVPSSMVVNDQGQLYVMGISGSSDYPTTGNAAFPNFLGGTSTSVFNNFISFNNGSDIVLTKFNVGGTSLLGSTYLGGSGNDGLNQSNQLNFNYGDALRGEVIVDFADEPYITSSTHSSDLPASSWAAQDTLAGGQDVCLFKLTSDLSGVQFCTYFGGTDDDAGYSLKRSPIAGIYFTGGTESTNLPIVQGWQTSSQGNIDGYIAQIDDSASTFLNGSYIGTGSYDQSYLIDLDTSYNVLLYGQSNGGYPVYNANYSDPNSGQFIQKLPPSLDTTLMSTVFGTGSGNVDISPSAFMISTCNNIYLSGWGGGVNQFHGVGSSTTSGLPTTSNAYQTSTDGSDFYLMVLGENASSLKYGSFFGGGTSQEHVDGGTSRFDDNGIVYQAVCGGCGGNNDFPTTPGAWSTTNNSSNCNLAAFKFDLSQLTAGIQMNNPPMACTDDTMDFDFNGTGGVNYFWDFGDGDTATGSSVSHVYTDTGTYEVKLLVTDTLTCFQKDSAKVTVEIHAPSQGFVNNTPAICPGDSVQLNAGGAFGYSWSPSGSLNDSTIQDPVASPDSTTQYQVLLNECPVDTTQVTDTAYTTVQVYEVISYASPDTLICLGDSVRIFAYNGSSFSWSPASSLDDPSVWNPYASPTQTTEYTVTIVDSNSCELEDTVEVVVDSTFPQAQAYPDTLICIEDNVQIHASGGHQFTWYPSEGLSSTMDSVVTADPQQTTTYHVDVKNGCGIRSDSVTIQVQEAVARAWPDTSICPGTSVQLYGEGGEQYEWTPSNGLSDPHTQYPVATPPEPTTYSLTIQDSIGCEDTAEVKVQYYSLPELIASDDRSVEWGSRITLEASGSMGDYVWGPSDHLDHAHSSIIEFVAKESRTYWVTLTDTNDCEITDSVDVIVSGSLYLPNAFTPDGDGVNDTWGAKGRELDKFHLVVFDRWGEVVFETKDIDEKWNGKVNGHPAKQDVYVWKVIYSEKYKPNKMLEKTGHVTLIK